MLDIHAIPNHILADLRSRDNSDEDIKNMTAERAFKEYCQWHGLSTWGSTLIDALDALRQADRGEGDVKRAYPRFYNVAMSASQFDIVNDVAAEMLVYATDASGESAYLELEELREQEEAQYKVVIDALNRAMGKPLHWGHVDLLFIYRK
jgi:hypothetical protein